MNDSAKEETTASTYGPWVVVTRRRHEARNQEMVGPLWVRCVTNQIKDWFEMGWRK